jgi:GNAT superfamily N-acetyltransferase
MGQGVSLFKRERESMTPIRSGLMAHLDAICVGLPERSRPLHSRRILQQDQGHGLYLFAWVDERPVGHVMVKWPSWPERPGTVEWQARYGCCFIEDLWVQFETRNQGIGRALMGAAESYCRLVQDSSKVGLNVGLDEGYQAALHIYYSTGYKDPGHGFFIESSPGAVEQVIFLLKELA